MLIYARVGFILTAPTSPPAGLRLPIPEPRYISPCAHQPNKYYVFPLYHGPESSDQIRRIPSDFGRAIAKFRARRLRRCAAVSEVERFAIPPITLGAFPGIWRRAN